MVHTKTILAFAIILIIQAKGNEIVVHGQGSDGSYNEFRKSESSLPGGVSKTVVITRRMLASPGNTLNLVSSSVGSIGKPGLTNFGDNLQSPFGINSQWNLPPQNSYNQWNVETPWSRQLDSASRWNLAPQNADNQWNVETPWSRQPDSASRWNLAPQNADNQWNLATQWTRQPDSASRWNLPPQNVDQQWNLAAPWTRQPDSASRWNLAPPNVDNQWNSADAWNPNQPSAVASQWNLPPQNVGNQWNSGALYNLNQQPAYAPSWNFSSQPGANSKPINLPWKLSSPLNLLQINSQNNENSQPSLNSQPSGSGSLESGNAPWNINAQIQPSGSSQWYSANSNLDLNPSSHSALVDQWPLSHHQVDSVNNNHLWGNPLIGSNGNYPGNSIGNLNSEWNSNYVPGLNINRLQNSFPSSHQQDSWLVNQPLNAAQSNYYRQGLGVISGLVPTDIPPPILKQQLRYWGRKESPSAVEKRSTDEAEEDSAEGHWLKK